MAVNYMGLIEEEDAEMFDGAVMRTLREHDMGGQPVGVFVAKSAEAINAELSLNRSSIFGAEAHPRMAQIRLVNCNRAQP